MTRKLTITGIAIGALLALGPVWGTIGTALAIQRSFTVLARSGDGNSSAAFWSARAVSYFQIGLVACPIGIALCIFSILKLEAIYRQPPSLPPPARDTSDSKA